MADDEIQQLRAQLAEAQAELTRTRRSLRRSRDECRLLTAENAQLADEVEELAQNNQQLVVNLAVARTLAQERADTIERDEGRINRLCDSVGELTGQIRAGISLATARLIRHRSEKGTKAPSARLEHKYMITTSTTQDRVTYTVSQGQAFYLAGRLERLRARGAADGEGRTLPIGNGVDMRRCVQNYGNAELERILTPEELRLVSWCYLRVSIWSTDIT